MIVFEVVSFDYFFVKVLFALQITGYLFLAGQKGLLELGYE